MPMRDDPGALAGLIRRRIVAALIGAAKEAPSEGECFETAVAITREIVSALRAEATSRERVEGMRERCAQIAELGCSHGFDPMTDADYRQDEVATSIAAAIRALPLTEEAAS